MQIKRLHPNRKKMLVGRGGKRGKTSGRGTKGQKARAGRKIRPALRDIIKKLPRLRGVTINKRGSQHTSKRLPPVAIPVGALAALKGGESVTPALLVKEGIVSRLHGRVPRVKVIAGGELKEKLSLSGVIVSKGARAQIESAGGTVA